MYERSLCSPVTAADQLDPPVEDRRGSSDSFYHSSALVLQSIIFLQSDPACSRLESATPQSDDESVVDF